MEKREMTVTGRLYNSANKLLKSGEFTYVLAGGEKGALKSTTNNLGHFTLHIPKAYHGKNLDVLFKLEDGSFFRKRIFVNDQIDRDLKKVRVVPMEDIEGDRVDIIKGALSSKIKGIATGLFEKIDEKLDFVNLQDAKDIKEAFGFGDTPETPFNGETLLKFFTNGLCYSTPLLRENIEETDYAVAQVTFGEVRLDQKSGMAEFKAYYRPFKTGFELAFVDFRMIEPGGKREDYKRIGAEDLKEEHYKAMYNACFYKGEVSHVGKHFYGCYVAQIALTIGRKHPMIEPFWPFLKYNINITENLGAELVVGKEGAINEGALDPDDISFEINNYLGGINPFSTNMRAPINEDHRSAKLRQIFQEQIIRPYVKMILEEKRGEIEENWKEAYDFFKAVHQNSPIYCPPEGEEDPNQFWDRREFSLDSRIPSRTSLEKGSPKLAFPRICRDKSGPQGDDWALMEEYWVNVLMNNSFEHTFNHLAQLPENIRENSKRKSEVPVTDPVHIPFALDRQVNETAATNSLDVLGTFAGFLEKTGIKYSPLGVADQRFVVLVENVMDELEELGCPVDEMYACIPI